MYNIVLLETVNIGTPAPESFEVLIECPQPHVKAAAHLLAK